MNIFKKLTSKKMPRHLESIHCPKCGRRFSSEEFIKFIEMGYEIVGDFPCPKCHTLLEISLKRGTVSETASILIDCPVCGKALPKDILATAKTMGANSLGNLPCPNCQTILDLDMDRGKAYVSN